VHTEILWGNKRKRDHLEDQVVEGSTILIWIFKMLDGGMD